MRVQRARDTSTLGDLRDEPSYLPWLLVALAAPALALVLWSTDWAAVSWLRVAAIPAVLLAVAGASAVTHWAGRTRPAATAAQAGEAGGAAARTEDAVRTAGDLLAVAVVAVTGLGLVRSFTAAAMVVGRPYSWAFVAAVAIGFAVAALPWIVARGRLQKLTKRFDSKYRSTGWNRSRRGLGLWPADDRGTGGNDGGTGGNGVQAGQPGDGVARPQPVDGVMQPRPGDGG